MARRLAYYAGASAAAAAACLLKAAHQRPNFYSATVYLSQSNACMLILTNLLLVTACWALYGLQRFLYGPLRPIEIEQLSEKAWYAVLDTLLAMPSFREDVGGWLLTMFVLLLAGKVWGWIAEGRVDILEQQPPADPRWFHARLATSLLVSVGFDLAMFRYCCKTVIRDPRPGMMVIFTFEFAILSIFSLFTLCRYLLSVAESQIQQQQTVVAIEARKQEIREERAAARQAEAAEGESNATPAAGEDEEPIEVDENEVDVPGWEEKRRYLFALEVITDFVKLLIYLFFFVVSVTFNGLPMHIMRDVYMTFTAFSKRVADYVAYRRATSHMNTRYPDATSQEIQGDVCIICRETMLAWEQPAAPGADQQAPGNAAAAPPRRRDEGLRAKKLPCGHILHLRCLKAWLERQQVCPTCRRPVVSIEASSANGGAARPGAGANDARAANQGQQGQPAANQQPGRDAPARRAQGGVARMFNLGPLRIGFLNGPQEQVQNLMNQLQNPAGRPAAPAAAAPHDLRQAEAVAALGAAAPPPPPHLQQQQGGVQHLPQPTFPLGLPPLHNSQAIPPPFLTSRNRTAGAPSRAEQFNSVEQFIMQEAQNIRLEQLQLSRIAALYDELAQLRDQHDESNGGGPRVPTIPASGNAIPGSTLPTPSLVAGSGGANQTMSNGHEGLPAGLVLPEGWTLTPLFPVGHGEGNGSAQAINANAAATTSSSAQPLDSQDASSVLPPTTTTTTPANQSTTSSTARDTATSSSSQGPTDEHGSPLFLPTLPQAAPRHPQTILTPTPTIPLPQARPHPSDSTAASHHTSTLSSTSPAISPPGTASSIPQIRQSTAQHPPAQGRGTHDEDEDDEEEEDDEDEDEDDDSEEETKTWSFPKDAAPSDSHPSSTGKGKAKAVEVEDAEDPEA